MTATKKQLEKKHGTPLQFQVAVMRAIGEISVKEAMLAIKKYKEEWNRAK
jgi:hypothetical protein